MTQTLILLICFNCILAASCKDNRHKKQIVYQRAYTGKLIPIDFSDSNYAGIRVYTIDTITQNGWSIKYFVKDDSTRYNDIYITWSKGNMIGTYKGEALLNYRRYFIPEYVGENSSCLLFEHGCATDCKAVLTLSKNAALSKDFRRVIDYNISDGQIAFVTDKGVEDDQPFQIAIADLIKDKEHLIQFKNLCMSVAYKESCIDTIIFEKNRVFVRATLTINNYDRDKEIIEEKAVNMQ